MVKNVTADSIGIRLLRREIRELEIKLEEIKKRSEGTTDLFFVLGGHDVEIKLENRIEELESLGYEYQKGWND
jgi:prefoldin subunit 5